MGQHSPASVVGLVRAFGPAAVLFGALSIVGAGSLSAAPAVQNSGTQAKGTEPQAEYPDLIIFKNGTTLACKIVSETAGVVRVKAKSSGGLSFETDYPKSDILKVTRGAESKDGAKPATEDKTPAVAPETVAKASAPATDDPSRKKYYVLELTGKFGRDISQTPIRAAMEDAKKQGAELVVVVMDNDWWLEKGIQEKGDEEGAFDELRRAEEMDGIFTDEAARWSKPPKVVFWVKKAMGGAAFLPLVSPNIYFSSEGKMGGIGNLTRLFGSTGDDVVRQKQYSLRLGHAEGLAMSGGYSPLIVRAMTVPEFVLSYKIEGGKPVLLERMPEANDEFLLTDDADEQKGNRDTDVQLARGEGNDALTLNAKNALDLQISKGTVDSIEELLDLEGVARSAAAIKGRSEQIMKDWSEAVDKAQRDIRRLMQEADEVPQGNDFQGRTRARGQQKRIYQQVMTILDRYGEALGKAQSDQLKVELKRRQDQLDADQQRDAQQNKKK